MFKNIGASLAIAALVLTTSIGIKDNVNSEKQSLLADSNGIEVVQPIENGGSGTNGVEDPTGWG